MKNGATSGGAIRSRPDKMRAAGRSRVPAVIRTLPTLASLASLRTLAVTAAILVLVALLAPRAAFAQAAAAALYEHYFPAADRASKCQGLDGNQLAVDVRNPNAADPAANVAFVCHTTGGDGDVCYLRKDGGTGLDGFRTAGGHPFNAGYAKPKCSDHAPPCHDSAGDLNDSQNPFTANCAGPPSGPRATVFILDSTNGEVSAKWAGDADLQNEETVPLGTAVTFTATPDLNYAFSAWSGGCAGEAATVCVREAAANVTARADFIRTTPYAGACALSGQAAERIAACDAKGWGAVELEAGFGFRFCYCDIDIRKPGDAACTDPAASARLERNGAGGGDSHLAFYFGDTLQHLPQKTEQNRDDCFVAKCADGAEPSGFNLNGETECVAPSPAAVFISDSPNARMRRGNFAARI